MYLLTIAIPQRCSFSPLWDGNEFGLCRNYALKPIGNQVREGFSSEVCVRKSEHTIVSPTHGEAPLLYIAPIICKSSQL